MGDRGRDRNARTLQFSSLDSEVTQCLSSPDVVAFRDLLDRVAYTVTAGVVLLAVAALGIAERQGLTYTIRGFRSSTTERTSN